jgi:hypothetical protein
MSVLDVFPNLPLMAAVRKQKHNRMSNYFRRCLGGKYCRRVAGIKAVGMNDPLVFTINRNV